MGYHPEYVDKKNVSIAYTELLQILGNIILKCVFGGYFLRFCSLLIVVHVVRCYFRMANLLTFDADTLTMGPLIRSRFVREFTSICQLLGGSHYNMAAVGMRFLLFFKWKRHLNMVYSH